MKKIVAFLLIAQNALAQQPRNLPKPDEGEPLMLDNWTNIILYVIIPALVIVFYIVWRMRKNKKQD